jgi:hypothetical protein
MAFTDLLNRLFRFGHWSKHPIVDHPFVFTKIDLVVLILTGLQPGGSAAFRSLNRFNGLLDKATLPNHTGRNR